MNLNFNPNNKSHMTSGSNLPFDDRRLSAAERVSQKSQLKDRSRSRSTSKPDGIPDGKRDTGFGRWRTGIASVGWGRKRQFIWGMGILPIPPEGGAVDGQDAELQNALEAIGYVDEESKQ